ncbi:MAG: cytochrome c biogenesis CcdA family protein [Promethearchaeota archaeon]|jgi:cytochrome c-type biogenesis protein
MTDSILFLLALGGGIVSFLSPCNIAILPSFISYIGGQANTVKKSTVMSLVFSLGFSLMFALISTLFIFITGFIRYSFWLKLFSGIVIILLSIYLFFYKQIFSTKIKPNQSIEVDIGDEHHSQDLDNGSGSESPRKNYEGYSGSFLLGFSLGYSWVGCVTPIYLSIVIIISNQAEFLLGILVFLIYGLGIMIPFILIGVLIGFIKMRFLVKLIKVGSKIQKIFALILLYIGIELIMSAFGIPGLIPYF